MQVLLCDDDALLRAVVSDQLISLGHSVETANDGDAALAALRAKRFDLVILDFLMPKTNGLEVIEQLLSWPSRPRIVLMSAISAQSLPALGEAKVDAVLEKPVKTKALQRLLDSFS